MTAEWLAVVHLAAAAVLAGVGWLTQLALYPLFRRVGPDSWRGYHAAHSAALGRTVAVPWVMQGVTTVALVVQRPGGVPLWLLAVDALLAAAPVVVTAAVAVPLHRRLAAGPDLGMVDALLRANLARCVCWTAGIVSGGAIVVLAR